MNINLIDIVNNTLDKLYRNESILFENKSSERNLVFHFSRYFIEEIKDTKLKEFNVDCEYNRNALSDSKIKEIVYNYDKKKHKVYLDFILHKRGSNDYNILAIEFKKSTNKDKDGYKKDIEKLKVLTNQNMNAEFKYKLGMFIELFKDRKNVKITRIINGNVID